MSYFPIFMDVQDQCCLVVGGGPVAARRVVRLCKARARVIVVAPHVCAEITALADAGKITVWPREFAATDVAHCRLIFAATNDRGTNEQVAALARAGRVPINVADTPSLCSFVMPAVVDRAPIQIAISSGGAAPLLVRQLRARIETLVPASYGRLAKLMSDFRQQVKNRFVEIIDRRRFWELVADGPIAELVFAGQDTSAREQIEKLLVQPTGTRPTTGEVYLVGAGPGDPDLLTFRALRLMQQSDVVIYDRLVAPALVALARADADRIYVGKQRDKHTLTQDEINSLMIALAKQGKRVLRLKGGDPFIFGRGGEEIAQLADAGIPFQIVPGITAAAGCAAYAGIPLTHRDFAHTCTFVTGHMKDGHLDLNWEALVQPRQTIAVYMGMGAMAELCSQLICHGMVATTPAALVLQGTTNKQRVLTADLESLPEIAKSAGAEPPGLLIIGQVVSLHEKLAWFNPHRTSQPERAYSLSA